MPSFPGHSVHFQTPRLLLRPCELSDFEIALEYYRDPEFRMLMDPNPEYEVTREYLEAIGRELAGQGWLFTIEERLTHRAIGEICLQWMNVERAEVQPGEKVMRLPIGIWDKTLWREGYAREAATPVVEYAFRDLGIDRLCAMMVARDNPASLALFRSLGMRVVREIPARNEVDLEITPQDWMKQR